MIAPQSWLADYVTIKTSPKELGEKLTEVGLNTEHITKKDNDILFDLEITPNRPDLLSIVGVAHEISAIEDTPIKLPSIRKHLPSMKPKKELPLTIHTNSAINPRFTAIIIEGVHVASSPQWLKDRLEKIGQRPINNIVDITNYVMFELGNPLHAFDYDKIANHTMQVTTAQGGEIFESVDGISYTLPKDAVIIKDSEKIIDLCGIKGGANTATLQDTHTIVLRAPVEVASAIRKTSVALGLRSEASSIFERGVNQGGTIYALERAVDLILDLAGGSIASSLFDIKEQSFEPWHVSLRLKKLEAILGIKIPTPDVMSLLKRLHLSPRLLKENVIQTTIPTFRNDLKIEEDLIEEVARLYGYNNFPKTLPTGFIPTEKVAYHKNYKREETIKQMLCAGGFSEMYTYSLVSEQELTEHAIDPATTLRVANPVSQEFAYLRPTLRIALTKALAQNLSHTQSVNLFEVGKIYKGAHLDSYSEEYMVAGISSDKTFYEVKGILERLFFTLNIYQDPSSFLTILPQGVLFEIPLIFLMREQPHEKIYEPLPKYPPIFEDLSFFIDPHITTQTIINAMKEVDTLIHSVSLLDQYNMKRTFHVTYLDKTKNITTKDTEPVREQLVHLLQNTFRAKKA